MSAAHLIFVLRAVLILVASKPQSHLLVLRRFMIRGQCDAAKQNTEQTVQDFEIALLLGAIVLIGMKYEV